LKVFGTVMPRGWFGRLVVSFQARWFGRIRVEGEFERRR